MAKEIIIKDGKEYVKESWVSRNYSAFDMIRFSSFCEEKLKEQCMSTVKLLILYNKENPRLSDRQKFKNLMGIINQEEE